MKRKAKTKTTLQMRRRKAKELVLAVHDRLTSLIVAIDRLWEQLQNETGSTGEDAALDELCTVHLGALRSSHEER